MKKARNFKSKAAYQKFLAYGHMHGNFENTPGNMPIKIMGKEHIVQHEKFMGQHIKSKKSKNTAR